MNNLSHAVPLIRHLEEVGGHDIFITRHGIYELRARKLDEEEVRQAVVHLNTPKDEK